MDESDIDFALNLTNVEEWAYSRNEFERMFRLPHSGCFVGDGDPPSGFVSSIQYGNTAVISHLIVSTEARGRRIGKGLMEASLAEIDDTGADSILLFSTSSGERLYASLGFRHLRDVVSLGIRLPDEGFSRTCPAIVAEDMDEVCALDRHVFGDDRSLLLKELFREHSDECFKHVAGGRIKGFVFSRRTPLGGDIGPWTCATGSRDDASALLSSAMSCFSGERVELGFFEDVSYARELLEGYEVEKQFRVKLMVKGTTRYPRSSAGAVGIAGFELG